MQIKKVAVIGSGVMGSAIAAHLANAGIKSLLLDIVPSDLSDEDKKQGLTTKDPKFRNKLALHAINDVLTTLKPSPIYDKKLLKLIRPANLEDNLKDLEECDWIVEVVVERLDIKQQVYAKIEPHLKEHTIVSSNTSGIPLKELVKDRSQTFTKNFLITHFFNPVRYMKLVEVVGGDQTSPEILAYMSEFLGHTLGKGVVTAKDTPSFIANRIGVFTFMNNLHLALKQGLSVEAVDKITGPATGKPKSATFRTGDLAGLDTIVHVAHNNKATTNDERGDALSIPDILDKLIQNKWLGQKVGQGFYKKTKTAEGKKEIHSLNLKTGEYGPQEKVRYDSLGMAKNIDDVGERIKTMINSEDAAGEFAWLATRDTLLYSANRVPEIADDVLNTDNGMKWGYNWDLGPFEILDAIGVKDFQERIKKEGFDVPAIITAVLEQGDGCFYKTEAGVRKFFDIQTSQYKNVPTNPKYLVIKTLKDQGKVLKNNDGASIIDLGDGVLNVEFHTKMNAIDNDVGQMINEALDILEKDQNKQGLVISNDAANFSVGANLMLLWMEAQQQGWDNINNMIKAFQDVCLRLRYSSKPVVAAPGGMALGGGCEVILGCDAIRAHAETYVGLVEVGAGLIPGGGGNKNLLMNIEANLLEKGPQGWAGKSDGGPFPKVQKCFETIGFAKVATSAVEGQKLGYFAGQGRTKISLSRDELLHDAKNDVLELAKSYNQDKPREDILVPGQGGKMAIFAAIEGFLLQGQISEHDALIAKSLAHVLCGGDIPTQAKVSEQYLLDIEREAFLKLCGEEKTQARMQNLLMKGKPLRN